MSRILTADTIYGFSALLHKDFDNPVATPAFHKELWALCASDHKQVGVAAPRGHAKSTAVTHTYGLAATLFRDKEYVLLVSDTESQAVQFLHDIKKAITDNEDLQELFGVADIIKDTETHALFEMDDGHQFRYLAKGSGQKVRGTKIDNKRPDLILGDDLENDEMVLNGDRREAFRRWFFSALLPCLSKHGQIRIVGTILHMDSLLERLMPIQNKAKGIELIRDPLREYTRERNPLWKSVRYRAHNPDFSHILWEEQWSKERLQKEYNNYLSQGMPEGYAQEYLNYPIDESTAYFQRTDLRPFPEEREKKPRRRYAAIDYAVSDKERRDFTVISVVEVDNEGIVDVVDVRRGRWDARDIIDEMIAVQKAWQPDLFTTEKGAIDKAIGPFLKEALRKAQININLNPMAPTKDKVSRARSLQGRMRAGQVRFNKEAVWYPALEEELLRFPKGAHDDQVDSLAWIGLTLDQIIYAETEEELEEEEWEDTYGDEYYGQGRSFFCGY